MTKNTCPPIGVKSRPIALLLAGLLWAGFAQAQESVNTSGGDATGSGGTVAYSVGQVVYKTNTGSTGITAQGVQHAYEIFSNGINETTLDISISVFPNPTENNLTLQINDYNNEKLTYQLYDMQGILLSYQQITARQTQINMHGLPSATYLILIVNQENKKVPHVKSNQVGAKQFNVVKSFKIIKN